VSGKKATISRRTLLRGIGGIAVALPFLEAMEQPARAATPVAPKRLIIMYTSNGTVLKNWKPAATGADFPISTILTPLDTPLLRPHLSVISGLKMASAQKLGGNGHARGMTNMLTGRPFTEIQATEFGDVGWGSGISIDQELAKRLADPGQLPSIELGVQTKKQYTNFYAYMSYGEGGGSENAISSDDDPRSAYQRLFGNVPDATKTQAALQKAIDQKKSVLDFVREDFARVKGKLGTADRQRLEKHAQLILDFESQLGVGAFCAKPAEPAFADADLKSASKFPAIGKAHMDLLAIAMSCDITRVGTLQWGSAQAGTVFETFIDTNWDDIPDKYHHGISHAAVASSVTDPTTSQASALQKLTLINTWFAEQLAYLGTKLAEMDDVDGTKVLDNTAILWVSEVSEGPTHKFTDMPYVLLGGAGGALRTNQHFAFDNQRTHNDLFVTLGQALGVQDFASFGDSEFCSGPIGELLV
jgi:hypothetical protein